MNLPIGLSGMPLISVMALILVVFERVMRDVAVNGDP